MTEVAIHNNMDKSKVSFQFLKFDNPEQDKEKEAKLRAAASKIDEGLAKNQALSELIDIDPSSFQINSDEVEDTRPLYHRLQEQKLKKKESLEEAQRMSNHVSRLDDDDINFLEDLERRKHEEEQQKRLEEMEIIEAHRRVIESRKVDSLDTEFQAQKAKFSSLSDTTKATSSMRSRLSNLIKVQAKPKKNNSEQAQAFSTTVSQMETATSVARDHITPLKKSVLACYGDSDDEDEDAGSDEDMNQEPVDGLRRSSRRKDSKGEDSTSHPNESSARSPGSSKHQESRGQKRKKDDDESDDASEGVCKCSVKPKKCQGVLTCIGILPSMPSATGTLTDSDTSSDSDDEGSDCGHTLICRVRINKKSDRHGDE